MYFTKYWSTPSKYGFQLWRFINNCLVIVVICSLLLMFSVDFFLLRHHMCQSIVQHSAFLFKLFIFVATRFFAHTHPTVTDHVLCVITEHMEPQGWFGVSAIMFNWLLNILDLLWFCLNVLFEQRTVGFGRACECNRHYFCKLGCIVGLSDD